MKKIKQKIYTAVDQNDILFCYIWLEKFHPILKHTIKYRVDFDLEDRVFVESQRWHIHDWGYAFFPVSLAGFPKKSIYMHRQIIQKELSEQLEYGFYEVDHIDWNKLNNRRSNLRVTNRKGNMENKPNKCPYGRHYIQTIHSNLYYAYAPSEDDAPAIFLGEFPTRAEAIDEQLRYKRKQKGEQQCLF